MSTIATANNWVTASGNGSQTCYTSFSLDANITISTSGRANCGSYWGSDWRLYQAQNGDVTITAAQGYTLSSVTFTYTVKNTGTLKDGNTTIATGAATSISGSSKTFTVGNTGSATNGQVKITAISVTYSSSGSNNPTLSLDPTSKEFEATGNSAQTIALTASDFASAVSSVTCAFFSNAECTSSISRPSWVNEPTVSNAKTQVSVNVVDNDGASRQTWMKITASDGSKNASAVFAISQKKYTAPTGTFNKFSGVLVEGDYVIYYDGKAMKNTIASSRFEYSSVTPANDKITNPDESLIWHITASGDYWTIYNAAITKYAAGTTTKGQGAVIDNITDYSKWACTSTAQSTTYDFANYGRSQLNSDADKKWLRNNSTYGFACYASGTGGALTLYKKALPTHKVTFTAAPTGGTVAVSAGGSSINTNADVEEGSTVTITPTPSTYYRLVSVTKGGQAIEPVQGIYSFTMPTSDVAIAVTFELIPVTAVTLNKSQLELVEGATETLSVSSVTPNTARNTVTWSSTNTNVATVTTAGVVTAVAAGNTTIKATSTVSTSVYGSCALTVTAPSGNPITISQTTGGTVTANVADVTDVVAGTSVTLTATPADGYSFGSWTVLDDNLDNITPTAQSGNTFTFDMPDGEVLAEATFTHEEAVLKLHDANGESTFDSEHTHYWKESVTLPSTAAACSKAFMGWSADADRSTAPEIAKGASYTIPNKGTNRLYAVYATIENDDVTITPSAVSDGDDPHTITIDQAGYTLSANKNTGSTAPTWNSTASDVRIYAKGDITLTSSKTMKSIVFNISTQGLKRLAPITASVGTIATQTSGDETVTWTGSATSVTFTVGDQAEYGSDGASKAGQLDFSTIDVVAEGDPSDYSTTCAQQVAAPTFSVEAGMYTTAQTIHISAVDGATIYYTTDGTKPSTSSTVFSADIVLDTRAITTIKAIAVKAGYANSNVASAAYNINLPFTVADAIAIIPNNNDERANTYIDGIVCTAGTEVSDGTMLYYISDDGAETSRIRIYDGKGLNNEDFSATTDLKVGDKVRVFGKLNNYNGSYDMDNSYLTSLEVATVSSVAISGTATKTAYSLEDNIFSRAGLIATATYSTGYVKDVTNEAGVWSTNLSENIVTEAGDVTVIAAFGGRSDTKVVTVTYTSKTVESISLSYNAKTVYVGAECPEPVVTAIYEEDIDDEDVSDLATFDKSAYVANTAGTYTINVSYQGKNASYDVTVKAIANDQATAYTAVEINDIIVNAYKSTTVSEYDVYVKGIVVENAYTTSGNSVYHISADGTTTNQFYIYGAKYFDPSTSATGNVKAGDDVIVKGNIQYYNSATPELKSSTVVYQLREGALTVNNVAEFEVGQPDLAEADLTINRNGSTGAITFSCAENDALEIVENGTKLRAKGEATADVTVTATMAADNTEGKINFTGASTTFTVHVIPAQTRYAVTFNLDEGSADPTPSLGNQLENANVIIPAGTYSKVGYKFNGWVVKETESEDPVDVTENDGVYSFTMPAAAVTVTAQWLEGSEVSWVAATWASNNNINSNTDLVGNYETISTSDASVSMTWIKNSGNTPAYNSGNHDARLYRYNSLTCTAADGLLLKGITLNFSGDDYHGSDMAANCGEYNDGVWTGFAKSVTITNTGTENVQARILSIDFEYITGTVTTLSIDDIALKLGTSKDLVISTNVAQNLIAYTVTDESVATVEGGVATPVATGSTTVTATIAKGTNHTAAQTTFTITVSNKETPTMSFPEASYNANLGGTFTAPTLTKPEGVTVTYSSDNAAVSVVPATGAITINAEGTAVITATSVENDDYAVGTASYTLNVIDPNKDVLTASAIEVTGSYANWSDKTFGSTVKYAGNSTTGTGDNAGAIQMRKSSSTQANSGIVTTSAIGYLKSISATRKSGTNYLDIYAKNSAYTSVDDLYNTETQGTLIGTIASGAMTFEDGKAYSDNYKYIGIVSHSGAVYYDDITITWTPAEFESFDVTYKAGEATGEDVVESIEEGSLISLKAADTFEAPEGKIFAGWLLEGEEDVREAGSNYTVTAAATFTAQWISVYTITYKPGEAEGDDVTVNDVPAGDYELAENTFEAPANKEFAGWKLNNAGETLAAGENYNVTGNAVFTAQWSIIKQAADLAYTTTSYIITRGQSFEAPALTNPHSLAVTYSGNNDEVATVNATTGAITLQGGIGEVTVTATFEANDYYYAGEASYTLKVKDANLAGGWVRLTSSNNLMDGMKVIIAEYVPSGAAINAMGAKKNNNRDKVAGILAEGKLVADEGTEILTLVAVGNNFALKTADNKYLYAASSSQNYLKEQAKIDDNATWTISLSADGKATITAQGENTHNVMRYNSTSDLFSCYASGQQDIALYSKTVAIDGNTNASTLDEYADVVVADNATLVINTGTKPLGNITGNVEVNAPLQAEGVHLGVNNTMTVNSTVNVPSFSISVKLGSTGEATNVTVDPDNGNIAAPEGYVDMELSDNANPNHWHSFTVPFEVDALNGIYDAETGAPLQNEVNYAIMDYHGKIRAQGKYGWKKYRGTLQPGVFYLITIDGASKVLRFMKKEGSSYIAGNSMEMTYFGDGDNTNTNNGWCGVGNQNMFNGYVPSQYVAQVLNAEGTGYEPIDNTKAMSACIPFFIQVGVTVNLIMNTSAPSLAPRRMPAKGVERMKVFFGNENYTDKLFISASEEATNQYEIGKDLVKMTMNNTPNVPQIFGKAYGNKLCMIDAPMVNDQAEVALELYAPQAGTYTISVPTEREDASLYLTKDGAIIWDLTMSPYEAEFDKGATEGYGLMLVRKAPQVTTGVENVQGDKTQCTKVILNDHVYILRDAQLYDVTGKAVK